MRIREQVAMAVYQDNKVVLVHKAHYGDRWKFPQGGIENRETEEQAVRRELRDELSIEANVIQKTDISNEYLFPPETIAAYPDKNQFDGKRQNFYIVRLTQEPSSIVLGEDLDGFRWFKPVELLENIHELERDAAQRILKKLEQIQ